MAQAFGEWLVGQSDRMDWVGQLAEGAARDRDFPVAADPPTVRAYLTRVKADADLFEMLDDAEAEWLRRSH